MDIINILFKSKIRQKILDLFFSDESRKYYINEMAREVGTSQGTCRRELNNLARLGILAMSELGNLKYYQISKNNIFYNEFSAIIQKTIGIETNLRKAISGVDGVLYAFVFGSYAKKNFAPESDIDIAVIGSISEKTLRNKIKDIEKITKREINYHLYSDKEFKSKLKMNSFIQNIIKDCILIAGDEKEFRRILKTT